MVLFSLSDGDCCLGFVLSPLTPSTHPKGRMCSHPLPLRYYHYQPSHWAPYNNVKLYSCTTNAMPRIRKRYAHAMLLQKDSNEDEITTTANRDRKWQHYYSLMRPITILQAVGAFLVGRLVILSQQQITARTTTATITNIIPTILAHYQSIYSTV